MILCIILVQCMRLYIYLKFYVPFIIYELSFILMFRITITTKECLYSKNFTLTIRTTFCSVMIDKARVHSGGTISPYAFMMPAIAIDECTHSPKNQGVFVKHYSMPPAATKSKKLFLASRSKSRSQDY